jgi:hypothetical protein
MTEEERTDDSAATTEIPAGPDTGSEAPKTTRRRYTAIVYFHGMGSPRRHEQISRLTDELDLFAGGQDAASVGHLRDQKVLLEPSRTEDDEDVAFVEISRLVRRFTRADGKGRLRKEGSIRIYEGFWSPHAASDLPWWRVLLWLLSRFVAPVRVLSHPWRAHQRLKLATLYRMQAEHPAMDRLFGRLEDFYLTFENWAARREAPSGGFSGFLAHVSANLATASQRHEAIRLAKAWRRRFLREQLTLLFLILTAGAAAASGILLLALYAVACARFFAPEVFRGVLLPFETHSLLSGIFMGGVAVVLLAMFLKTKRYLETFWADVMFWTTQEEKTARFIKRKEILAAAVSILTHVLRDEDCTRVVVVGYSLGSAIAHESLLRLGRRAMARKRLGKTLPTELARLSIVSHLITVGSPIDRIHYFFELHDSRSHRYNRIREKLKGSTDDAPFTIDGKPSAAWVNLWDDADGISSGLFSPRASGRNASAITEVWAPGSHRLNPLQAHSAYFNSVPGMRVIFWLAVIGRMPPATEQEPSRRGPFFRFVRPWTKWLGITLTWTVLALLVSAIFFDAGTALAYVAFAQVLVLFALEAAGALADRRRPLLFSRTPRDA